MSCVLRGRIVLAGRRGETTPPAPAGAARKNRSRKANLKNTRDLAGVSPRGPRWAPVRRRTTPARAAAHAVDKSASSRRSSAADFYASADPVCIISTMVHACTFARRRTTTASSSQARARTRSRRWRGTTSPYSPRSTTTRSRRPGCDRGIAHEGSTFAMYNKFKGDDLRGNQMA